MNPFLGDCAMAQSLSRWMIARLRLQGYVISLGEPAFFASLVGYDRVISLKTADNPQRQERAHGERR
jgi:hypothetical protein